MYKTLKKLGLRDDKRSAPSEQFSAEEIETHFKKVSKKRSEHTSEAIQEVISWIPDRREEQEVKRAAEKLEKEVTVGEILERMKEMSDGAAAEDDVTIGIIRKCNPETQIVMAEKMKEMAGRNPDEWENTNKEGVVIPLYKNKGKRDQMNNYRGICLLFLNEQLQGHLLAIHGIQNFS